MCAMSSTILSWTLFRAWPASSVINPVNLCSDFFGATAGDWVRWHRRSHGSPRQLHHRGTYMLLISAMPILGVAIVHVTEYPLLIRFARDGFTLGELGEHAALGSRDSGTISIRSLPMPARPRQNSLGRGWGQQSGGYDSWLSILPEAPCDISMCCQLQWKSSLDFSSWTVVARWRTSQFR